MRVEVTQEQGFVPYKVSIVVETREDQENLRKDVSDLIQELTYANKRVFLRASGLSRALDLIKDRIPTG